MVRKRLTRYDLMENQIIGDVEWPDPLSLDLDNFIKTKVPTEVLLRSNDVFRPDLFFYNNMSTNNLEDIVLWLNDIPSRREMEAGNLLELPMVSDLNKFYLVNRK